MLYSAIGIGLIAAVTAVMIKSYRPEMALVISISAGVLIMAAAVITLSPAFEEVKSALERANVSAPYISVLFKALGICYLTAFAADTCKDAGEQSIASKVELAGKAALILVSLPMFKNILDMVTGLIK